MDKTLYQDTSTLFTFDRLACLRNEYAKNECDLCSDICPSNAFILVQGKLRLSVEACTNCGACIGVCPTNALSLLSFDTAKVLSYIVRAEAPRLTCKENTPCLSALSVEMWTTLLLESKKSFTCNLFDCQNCDMNTSGKISASIEKRVDEANEVALLFGEHTIIKDFESSSTPSSRRAFLTKWLPTHKEESVLLGNSLAALKKVVKSYLQTLPSTKVAHPFSFIHQKSIEESCTNCKECVQFCPTGALSYNNDNSKILFQLGKCIGCSICEDICKPKSIHKQSLPFDWVDFAYDKAKILVEHNLQVCLTCKCAFSYKGGDKICERCASFEREHGDMFRLASEIS
ncbi:MAG: 4Fe-4S binding protein [Campylobacteraceae bacterium]|nr:4Fe-4S binding protein [Campylobacteraceae bacterium]